MKENIKQAYRQLPWRVQIKWGSGLLLILTIISMVAVLYLSITAQTAAAGVEMQLLILKKSRLIKENADAQVQLADITSAVKMGERAEQLGFEYPKTNQAIYVVVPDYTLPQPTPMAPQHRFNPIKPPTLIKSIYTQSLWDWLTSNSLNLGSDQEVDQQ